MRHSSPELDRHLDECDFVVVDVETTGLSALKGDRICEIGVVKLRNGVVQQSIGTLIDPCRPVSPGAFAVNRISASMLAGAPKFADIAPSLVECFKGSIIVAYNAPFDLSFLMNECRLTGLPSPNKNVIDALQLARQLLPGLDRYHQESVARALGIPFPVKHRALEDAMITAQIFSACLSILKAFGYCTAGDCHRVDLHHLLQQVRLDRVHRALQEKRLLHMRYLSTTKAEISERTVTPLTILEQHTQRARISYLTAFCHAAKDERNFRVDRILDVQLVDSEALP